MRQVTLQMDERGRKLLLAAILLAVFLLLTIAIHQVFRNNTPGIDFYVYWQAGRAFFFEGQDPYSPQVSERIQVGIYGRKALPAEDPMHYANPAYGLLAVLPWLVLPFDWAQAAWMSFNFLALNLLLFAAFPRAPRWVLLLTPFFYPVVFGLLLGNFAALNFGILALSFGILLRDKTLSRGAEVTVGLLLAWLTVKPQSIWLYLPILLLLAWRRRASALLISFASGLAGMLAISLAVRLDWPLRWFERLLHYAGYSNYQPSRVFYLDALLPAHWIETATIVIGGALILLCIVLAVRWLRGRLPLLVLLSWCALTMYFLHPNSLSYEQLVLLLPLFLWAVDRKNKEMFLLFIWLGGWVFSYALLFASWNLGSGWPVNHLPLAVYCGWMVWLHAWWLPRERKRA